MRPTDPTGPVMNSQQCGKQEPDRASREPWSDQEFGWDPSLVHTLRRCLRGEETSARQLAERLEGLERDYQDSVYSELIFLQTSENGVNGSEWWILDDEGEWTGRVEFPNGLRVLLIHGDEVWGVETDDLDVNYIVKYSIVRP